MTSSLTGGAPLVPAVESSVTSIRIFTTWDRMYLIGSKVNAEHFVLTLDRNSRDENFVTCHTDKRVYNQEEIDHYVQQLQQTQPTIKQVGTARGLLGFVRFTSGFYCHFVTKVNNIFRGGQPNPVGHIGGHPIHVVRESKLFSISNKPASTSAEARMKGSYEACDLGRGDCFFSHTYDLTHTLQANVLARKHASKVSSKATTSNERFVWNARAMRALIMSVGVPSCWILPLIHGYFEQLRVHTTTGRRLALTLIARRSRHYAGTRYNRRGCDVWGNVANEVETEQLLCDVDTGMATSLVQVRGSIPLHWCHYNLRSPKPGIKLWRRDLKFQSAKKHFENLRERYGSGNGSGCVASINLILQNEDIPKETILLEEYQRCIPWLNSERRQEKSSIEEEEEEEEMKTSTTAASSSSGDEDDIVYVAYDFNMNAKDPDVDVLTVVTRLLSDVSNGMGFFCSSFLRGSLKKKWSASLQSGVIRTNCIDCLDRTNATQFCLGRIMLPRQLKALGVEISPSSEDDLWPHLVQMWARHGNEMGMQYAGSGAMHSVAMDTTVLGNTAGNDGGEGTVDEGRREWEGQGEEEKQEKGQEEGGGEQGEQKEEERGVEESPERGSSGSSGSGGGGGSGDSVVGGGGGCVIA